MYQLMRSALRLPPQCHQCNCIRPTTPTTTITRYLRCYRCGAENDNDELICANCNQVQQPPPIAADNYFTVFSLNPCYEISIVKLKKRYRFMQRALNPGKIKNDEDRAMLATYSALLNKAYTTLHAPFTRAQHLLAINGTPITDEEAQKATDNKFLMQMMDLNEEVECAADKHELHYLRAKNDAAIGDMSKSIAASFRTGHLDKVRQLVIKLKHYDKLSQRIFQLLNEPNERK